MIGANRDDKTGRVTLFCDHGNLASVSKSEAVGLHAALAEVFGLGKSKQDNCVCGHTLNCHTGSLDGQPNPKGICTLPDCRACTGYEAAVPDPTPAPPEVTFQDLTDEGCVLSPTEEEGGETRWWLFLPDATAISLDMLGRTRTREDAEQKAVEIVNTFRRVSHFVECQGYVCRKRREGKLADPSRVCEVCGGTGKMRT